jgi:hypothetical protein
MISASRLTTFKRCPREHHYYYTLRIGEPEESPSIEVGKSVHHALGDIWSGLAPYIPSTGDDFRDATVRAMVRAYRARYVDDLEQHRVIRVECRIERDPYLGILDVLTADAVVEHKTSSDASDDYMRSRGFTDQAMMYLFLSQRTRVIYDVIGTPSIRPRKNETSAEFEERSLPEVTLTRRAYDVPEHEILAWEQQTRRVVSLMDQTHQHPESCKRYGRWCQFLPICSGEDTAESFPCRALRS